MTLHDAVAERTFIGSFDAGRFPYWEPSGPALIREGWAISLNAAFCVLNELCRPPCPGNINEGRLSELVSEWAAGPHHRLKEPLLDAARALITQTPLPWREGIGLMRRVGEYDGQRAALAIAYFASDCSTPEADHALTQAQVEITQRWDARGI
jgi:hypothetical protein